MLPGGSDPRLLTQVDCRLRIGDPLEWDIGGVPLHFEMMHAAVGGTSAKAIGMAA